MPTQLVHGPRTGVGRNESPELSRKYVCFQGFPSLHSLTGAGGGGYMTEQNPTLCGTMSMKAVVPCEAELSGRVAARGHCAPEMRQERLL